MIILGQGILFTIFYSHYCSGFILNNTNTLDALYYKRAIEGVESNPEYRFTFSVPSGKG
jgi:hypothetical protein